jgi:hypothetical protein
MAVERDVDSKTLPLPDPNNLAQLRSPPTAAELDRRRRVLAKIMRLREEIDPIHDLTAADLLADDEDDEGIE